jgi:hypothetical protein
MPLRTDDNVVILEGHCTIEEAQALFDLLGSVEDPVFDIARAKTIHTAIVQLILASGGKVRGPAASIVLSACLRDRLAA